MREGRGIGERDGWGVEGRKNVAGGGKGRGGREREKGRAGVWAERFDINKTFLSPRLPPLPSLFAGNNNSPLFPQRQPTLCSICLPLAKHRNSPSSLEWQPALCSACAPRYPSTTNDDRPSPLITTAELIFGTCDQPSLQLLKKQCKPHPPFSGTPSCAHHVHTINFLQEIITTPSSARADAESRMCIPPTFASNNRTFKTKRTNKREGTMQQKKCQLMGHRNEAHKNDERRKTSKVCKMRG